MTTTRTGQNAFGVATLLLAMDQADAARILRKFDEAEIRQIATCATRLGPVPHDDVRALIDLLESQLTEGPQLVGSANMVSGLIQSALPDDLAERIMSTITDAPIKVEVWSEIPGLTLEKVTETVFAQHPQIAAYICARLEPAFAGAVIQSADRDYRHELFDRMLDTDQVTDRAARLLELHLSRALLESFNENTGDAHTQIAGILNRLERGEADELIDTMSTLRPRDAELIRGLIFDFSDILKMSSTDRAKLFEAVPAEKLILALNGQDETIQAAALGSLTARSRRMIEAELHVARPMPANDIAEVQRWISDLAIRLSQEGKLTLIPQIDETGIA